MKVGRELSLSHLQADLFGGWHHSLDDKTRTLDLYDSVPKFVLSRSRESNEDKLHRWPSVKIGQIELNVTLKAAALIDDGDSRRVRFVFPGVREELIERALRKMAVDRSAEMDVDEQSGSVRVEFTLRQLRNRLASDGHDFSASQTREGLEVMNACELTVEGRISEGLSDRLRGPLLAIRRDVRLKGGSNEQAFYAGLFHPLATHAILGAQFFLFGHGVMRLRLPLARWIATQINVRFRQAAKGLNGPGYKLSLSRIINQSGIVPEQRLRDTIRRVEAAIHELKREGFLCLMRTGLTLEEAQIRYKGSTGGRPKIADVTWTLYPSSPFVEEIITGNIERLNY